MEQKRWNFQCRFAFVGECGVNEGGVSREFYSGKTMDGQLCFKCFPLIYYFHILFSNLENNYLVNFILVNQVVLSSKKLKIASLCFSSHLTSFDLF